MRTTTIEAHARHPVIDAPSPAPPINRSLLAILAVAGGLTVANNYYNQAMLGLLAREFHLSAATVAILPVVTQLGNATGILFLAPLGDRYERRKLILVTMALLVLALAAAAIAPGFAWLAATGIGIGLFATVTQQVVPLAMRLAAPHEKGRVLGIVTGGILVGILLARVISGVISDLWGWRVVFEVAAVLMLLLAGVLALRLPRVPPSTDLSYAQLIGSLLTLLSTHAILRRAMAIQALLFSAFIAFWSNLALVFDAAPYHYGATAVGLMALVGVAGALAAPLFGRLADRSGPGTPVRVGAGLMVLSFAIYGLFQGSIAAMVIGVLVMDVAAQAAQVANQARVQTLDPAASSRLNTIFMAAMIFGGAAGAGAGGLAYAWWGWSGTCLYGALAGGAALLLARKS